MVLQYIAAARRTGQLEAVRGARERMNAVFPLSPQLWLQWTQDEQRLAIRCVPPSSPTLSFKQDNAQTLFLTRAEVSYPASGCAGQATQSDSLSGGCFVAHLRMRSQKVSKVREHPIWLWTLTGGTRLPSLDSWHCQACSVPDAWPGHVTLGI